MQEKEKKGRGAFLLLKMALFVLAAVALVVLAVWQADISEKREKLDGLNTQIAAQETLNEQLRQEIAALDSEEGLAKYAERKAREELDYAKPDERVFVDVGGGE